MLSQHIETRHCVELVSQGGFGYLLKDRVLDPAVVGQLIGQSRHCDPAPTLTPREREVLALMAEGRANPGIATTMHLTERTVETHVGNIMSKLSLPQGTQNHRRVLAVLAYLDNLPLNP